LLTENPGKGNFEAARQDNQKIPVELTRLYKHIAGTRLDPLAVRFKAADLLRRELGEHLLATLFEKIIDHECRT